LRPTRARPVHKRRAATFLHSPFRAMVAQRKNGEGMALTNTMKHDDFSCDPSRWSQDKLFRERRNGMPAVVAEYERRMAEHEAEQASQSESCPRSPWL